MDEEIKKALIKAASDLLVSVLAGLIVAAIIRLLGW